MDLAKKLVELEEYQKGIMNEAHVVAGKIHVLKEIIEDQIEEEEEDEE